MHVKKAPSSPPAPDQTAPAPINSKKLAVCLNCKAIFEKKKSWQKFCNKKKPRCRDEYHNNIKGLIRNYEEGK